MLREFLHRKIVSTAKHGFMRAVVARGNASPAKRRHQGHGSDSGGAAGGVAGGDWVTGGGRGRAQVCSQGARLLSREDMKDQFNQLASAISCLA